MTYRAVCTSAGCTLFFDEKPVVANLPESVTLTFLAGLDAIQFVRKCADSNTGVSIPAQDVLKKHGIKWEGTLERSTLQDIGENSVKRGVTTRAGMAAFAPTNPPANPSPVLDGASETRSSEANSQSPDRSKNQIPPASKGTPQV